MRFSQPLITKECAKGIWEVQNVIMQFDTWINLLDLVQCHVNEMPFTIDYVIKY
jgi:hypothetical protein